MSGVREMARGAAIAVASTVLIFGIAILLDLAQDPSRWVFLVGGLAGVLIGVVPRGSPRIEALGATAWVGLVAVSGTINGWGWLEISGVLGAAVGVIWCLTGQLVPGGWARWFRWGGVSLVLVVFLLLPLIIGGGTLGNDEAAYAVKAKSWLEGTPDTGWSQHRATGMSVYGYVVLALGGAEAALRMIGLAGLLALVVGVWLLARRMSNNRVAAVAALAMVAGPSILRRSSEYLSDVPSAALLVFCMVIVWREFAERDEPSYRLLWILPFAWGAFYLRYQSILSFGLIALTILILFWPKVKSRSGPLLAVLGLGALGLVPHAIQAIDFRGVPWGIVAYTGGIAERAYIGEGLVDYVMLMRWELAGFVGPIAVVAAIGGLFGGWSRAERRVRYLFLLIPAVLQVVALGLLSHGEARFVFFPLALVIVAGAMSVESWVSDQSRSWVAGVAIGLGLLVAGSLALSTDAARRITDNRGTSNLPVQLAAEEARSIAGAASCAVMTTPTPQVTYYSECWSRIFQPGLEPERAVEALQGEEKFMILIEGGRRQPGEADLAALIELTDGDPVFIEGAPVAAVYSFED